MERSRYQCGCSSFVDVQSAQPCHQQHHEVPAEIYHLLRHLKKSLLAVLAQVVSSSAQDLLYKIFFLLKKSAESWMQFCSFAPYLSVFFFFFFNPFGPLECFLSAWFIIFQCHAEQMVNSLSLVLFCPDQMSFEKVHFCTGRRCELWLGLSSLTYVG